MKRKILNDDELDDLAKRLLQDFDSVDNLKKFYYDHTRKELDIFLKDRYDISFYYFKKIVLSLGIESKPAYIYNSQRIEHTINTKKNKYENGNYDYDKFKCTMEERHGGIGFASEEIRSKYEETMLKRYGVDNPWKDPFNLNKNAYTKEAILKGQKTQLERTGYISVLQFPETRAANSIAAHTKEANIKRKKNNTHSYFYEGIHFDSSWELALWIYAKDHNEQIEREPVRLFYSDGEKQYSYFPDFLYKGRLVEIKADHLVDSEGNLLDFYNLSRSKRLDLKKECMDLNNVLLWKYNDIKFAVEYISSKYGKNYLLSFKNKKEEKII